MINKAKFLYILSLNLIFCACVNSQDNLKNVEKVQSETIENLDTFPIQSRLNSKIPAIQTFLKKNPSYNQKIVILIDMKQNSGKYRFFVYNLDSMKVVSKSLVAHGSGSETGIPDSLTFSNIPNSYCTSLGKYKIGSSYIGAFGKSYKLHGLDPTNNKALARAVVLHRYGCVPDEEQPYEICNSLGCPMVSENYFLELDKYISSSSKPILMEIYY